MKQIVEVGIEATLKALPESVVQQIEEQANSALNTAMEKNAGQFERGEA